jgi:hypothetical protein
VRFCVNRKRTRRPAQALVYKMLIYPDTSDLINLCIGRAGIKIVDLASRLSEKSHVIVFSMETLIEVAAPLRDDCSLEVRSDLNQLEVHA